ncbi:cytidylate kinase [Methanosalsum zhilinae DSM 4017]|uniref:Cytidylate kinase n=1 Tax=Methanosalsum zhilinae (strain DSM 4017 / NBRC 107636 / OCM 62 / WeN5) TaxID=679901 RepID=F7XMP1_METZD|nr:AAA family ATPase [Methanosalsum zhilinae]AEH61057.1 cytidylate kinase [Methanosalsum zhilinae DSM 4017]
MLLTVSGLPGSGTTTVSRILSEYYNIRLVSAGEVFRALAREKNMSLEEFGSLAENDPSIDSMIDERQKEIATSENNIILEGRLAGHMAEMAFRIWIKAPMEVRVERIAKRESMDFDQVFNETKIREASESLRYRDFYGIDINDLSIYDIVVDSKNWIPREIADILILAIDSYNESD